MDQRTILFAQAQPASVQRMLGCAALGIAALCLPEQRATAETMGFPVANQKWKNECGNCHVAYLPRFLPAPSWRTIMAGLERHFGTDASLDTESAAEVGAFLQSYARRDANGDAESATLRVTETTWFKRQHGELVPSVWTHRLVKTPVNCGACHASAGRGDFSEPRNWFRRRNSPSYAAAGLG